MLTEHREHLYAISQSDQAILDRLLPVKSPLLAALEEIDWLDEYLINHPANRDANIIAMRDLAAKILGEQQDPTKNDRMLSIVDPDARRGLHNQYYEGYSMSILVDADSSLCTSIDVLPANADEVRNELIKREEAVHKNDIKTLSIDGIGFHGPTLRELEKPQGLNIDVITPPRDFTATPGFDSNKFESINDGERLHCPEGHLSQTTGSPKGKLNILLYAFPTSHCRNCPRRSQCHPTLTDSSRKGRKVRINEFMPEFVKAREKSQTEHYALIRREHPMVERKFNEIANHYGGRRSRYWGLDKYKIQGLMIGFVMNLKTLLTKFRAQMQLSTV